MPTDSAISKVELKEHPTRISESSLLSNVALPSLHMDTQIAVDSKLVENVSSLQLEGILYASQRHQMMLPGGEMGTSKRAGFLLGDGAGVARAARLQELFCWQPTEG